MNISHQSAPTGAVARQPTEAGFHGKVKEGKGGHDFADPHMKMQCIIINILKLKFRKYPAIYTNYIISHSTTLQYNHNI